MVVPAAVTAAVNRKQDEVVNIEMPAEVIKPKPGADTTCKKTLRVKNIKILKLSRKSARKEQRRGRKQLGYGGYFLVLMTVCTSLLITCMVLLQHQFINEVQKELQAIQGKVEYQTEDTPYNLPDDKETMKVDDVAASSDKNSKSSTIGEDGDNKGFQKHNNRNNVRRDEITDYMQLAVVYRIYAYIYAFYISVTFLMIFQFFVIFRYLARH